MRSHARRFRSGLWLAIFAASTALVFSFILFDVLDIDGSDFPGPAATAATPAGLSEAPHDIRRAFLQGPAKLWIDATVLSEAGSWNSVRLHHAAALQPFLMGTPRAHGYRVALPRSSLLDIPPTAALSRL